MAQLYYQGHGSFRIRTDAGKVIYVDPYAGDGYDLPADLILVTHQHMDHNRIRKVRNRNGNCRIFTNEEAVSGENYRVLGLGWTTVVPVRAENRHHDPASCVGYIISVVGKKIYAAGDTSKYDRMRELKLFHIDLALLPTDGFFNMGPEEAAECAELCGAKQAVPIHTKPGALYDRTVAERFTFPGRILLEPGGTLDL